MVKLDVKDRKILFQLTLNSRQSFNQIGKKVGLTKDVVAYRVKKLQENGIKPEIDKKNIKTKQIQNIKDHYNEQKSILKKKLYIWRRKNNITRVKV